METNGKQTPPSASHTQSFYKYEYCDDEVDPLRERFETDGASVLANDRTLEERSGAGRLGGVGRARET